MPKRVLTVAAMNRYAGHLVAQAPVPPCPTREEVYDSHEQLRQDHAAALDLLRELREGCKPWVPEYHAHESQTERVIYLQMVAHREKLLAKVDAFLTTSAPTEER